MVVTGRERKAVDSLRIVSIDYCECLVIKISGKIVENVNMILGSINCVLWTRLGIISQRCVS